MEKLYYTIGEVAEILGESVSLVRFWTDSFPAFIKPSRNSRGNRVYVAADIDTFRQIKYLVGTGLTLEGAARRLRDDRSSVSAELRVLDLLRGIRSQLAEVRDKMKK